MPTRDATPRISMQAANDKDTIQRLLHSVKEIVHSKGRDRCCEENSNTLAAF